MNQRRRRADHGDRNSRLRRLRPALCEELESRLQLTTLTLSMSAVEVSAKAGTPVVFTVTRDNSVGNLLVNYRVGGEVMPADLTSRLSGSLTLAAGASTGTIIATPLDDALSGSNKSLTIQLEEPDGCGYTLGSASQGTVRFDESNALSNKVREVGPGHAYASLAAAYSAASPGDTIDIFANGSTPYTGANNSIVVQKNNLTIRGIGLGRVKVQNDPSNLLSIGIGIIVGDVGVTGLKIENLDVEGSRVADANGAGLRMQADSWQVTNCYFYNNENGILASAGGAGFASITYCEFNYNGLTDAGASPGQQHNVYVSTGYAQLTFEYNYSHDSGDGHLLKTRARLNYIEYNRLIGTKVESYEINVPDAGKTYIIGNIVHQSSTSQNGGIIDYASENAPQAGDFLYLVNNTVVNDRGAGTFVQASLIPAGFNVTSVNNIFAGPGTVYNLGGGVVPTQAGNVAVSTVAAAKFVDPTNFNYHLLSGSPAINAGAAPGASSDGVSLLPIAEPLNDESFSNRTADATLDSGAYDFTDTLPPWLAADSLATWDPVYKILTITGAARIIANPGANPGADQPNIFAASAGAQLAVQPSGGGAVQVGSITLQTGAGITLAQTSALLGTVMVVDGTVVIAGGKLDLSDGGLIVNPQSSTGSAGAVSSLESAIAAGRNGGLWNGTNGITSSTAQSDRTAHHFETSAVGIALNGSLLSIKKTFDNQSVNPNSVLLRYTVVSDVDLNGTVDDDDATAIGLYYDRGLTTGHHWWQGDLDGNGKIDDDDVSLLGLFYGSNAPAPAGAPTAVPLVVTAAPHARHKNRA